MEAPRTCSGQPVGIGKEVILAGKICTGEPIAGRLDKILLTIASGHRQIDQRSCRIREIKMRSASTVSPFSTRIDARSMTCCSSRTLPCQG